MMTTGPDPAADPLWQQAGHDAEAWARLLDRQRERLCRLVQLRMDPRLRARIDPSDVVQEALVEAVQQRADYLRHRPLPLYPWLRQKTLQKLVDLHRRHVQARRRSVAREEPAALPDESAVELARRLFARGSSPSAGLNRAELRDRVQAALLRLPERDREVLVLRHIEQLSPAEIAAVLGLTEGAVYTRHLRALRRLRDLLTDPCGGPRT
jgi:RNA polymerase sigma-70 factor (ECF subfamily)